MTNLSDHVCLVVYITFSYSFFELHGKCNAHSSECLWSHYMRCSCALELIMKGYSSLLGTFLCINLPQIPRVQKTFSPLADDVNTQTAACTPTLIDATHCIIKSGSSRWWRCGVGRRWGWRPCTSKSVCAQLIALWVLLCSRGCVCPVPSQCLCVKVILLSISLSAVDHE